MYAVCTVRLGAVCMQCVVSDERENIKGSTVRRCLDSYEVCKNVLECERGSESERERERERERESTRARCCEMNGYRVIWMQFGYVRRGLQMMTSCATTSSSSIIKILPR